MVHLWSCKLNLASSTCFQNEDHIYFFIFLHGVYVEINPSRGKLKLLFLIVFESRYHLSSSLIYRKEEKKKILKKKKILLTWLFSNKITRLRTTIFYHCSFITNHVSWFLICHMTTKLLIILNSRGEEITHVCMGREYLLAHLLFLFISWPKYSCLFHCFK